MAQAQIELLGRIDENLIQGFRNIADALHYIDVNSSKVISRLHGLSVQMGKMRAEMAQSRQEARLNAMIQQSQMNDLITSVDQVTGAIARLTRRVSWLGHGYKTTARQATAAHKDMTDAAMRQEAIMRAMELRIRRFYAGVERAIYPFRQMARGFVQATGFATLLGFGGFVAGGLFTGLMAKGIIQTGVAFEQFAQQIRTFTGDAARANIELEKVSEFAKRTPFELADVTASFVSLAQVGIAPTLERLTIIGDYAAAMAQPITRVADAVRAAVGGGQFDRLIELGIPKAAIKAIDPAAFTGEKVADRARALAAIMQYMQSRTSGMMERSQETLMVRWSNLLDSLTRSYKRLYDTASPILLALVDAGRQIIETLTKIVTSSPAFEKAAQAAKAGSITEGVTKGVTRIIAFVLMLADVWKNNVWPWIVRIYSILSAIVSTIYNIVVNSFIWRFFVAVVYDLVQRIGNLLQGNILEAIRPKYWWQWVAAIVVGLRLFSKMYHIAVDLVRLYKAKWRYKIMQLSVENLIHSVAKKQFWLDLKSTILSWVRMLSNPVYLVTFIAGLAIAAGLSYLIYRNWEGIKNAVSRANEYIAKLLGIGDIEGDLFGAIKQKFEIKLEDIQKNLKDILGDADKELQETMRDMLPPTMETAENTRELKKQMEQFLGIAGPALQRRVTMGEMAYAHAYAGTYARPRTTIRINIPPMTGQPIDDYIRNVVASAVEQAIRSAQGSSVF